ncbi:MAG: hypothetical protein QOE86_937 [Solirubrobacteraceae bacterium]|jgi:hypothetical protein|nr:hypothetical protein [Solirubrobacteraceae bacterium]
MTTFRALLEAHGKTATGFAVPSEVVEELGAGKRPAVRVTLNGAHTYPSTIASYGGTFLIGVSAANREAAGVAAGDELEVRIELDHGSRESAVPEDLAEALAGAHDALERFEKLTPTQRGYFNESVTSAKQPATRARRVEKAIDALRAGRKQP